MNSPASRPAPRHNRRTAMIMAGVALAMLGLGFASVPLYRIFCQVTGYGGTTGRASAAQANAVQVGDGHISVRFDGNVERGMAWRFAPQQITQDMRIGQRMQAFYTAENLSNEPITGVASFNVEPELVGKYFKKIQCFCFNQQTLQPGQKVDMPVIYYVDPAIADDPETKNETQITLSYTFHKAANGTAKVLDRADPAR
ncbi:MAG: cytochrome c oxidase assembly protein [Proteobacteria bacterium]|nr:cytochrome c oxidase assembly protein [Pseudomonadota bacterium]